MTLELKLKGKLIAPGKAKMDVADKRKQGRQDKEGIRGAGKDQRRQQAEPGAQQGKREIKRGRSCCGSRMDGSRAQGTGISLVPLNHVAVLSLHRKGLVGTSVEAWGKRRAPRGWGCGARVLWKWPTA